MRMLHYALAGLVLHAAPLCAQKPSADEAGALIEKAQHNVLAYTHALPDFVCTEVIARYKMGSQSLSNGSAAGGKVFMGQSDWQVVDKLTVKLSYFRQQEQHQLLLVNGEPTRLQYDSLDVGATGTGEFAGMLQVIFSPASQTTFRWGKWKKQESRTLAVFTYKVPVAHSQYELTHGPHGNAKHAIVGFQGVVEIDRETGDIVHFENVANQIPKELNLEEASTSVDYALTEVAGRQYLLPSAAETRMRSAGEFVKNSVAFRDYNKFDASSVIKYDGK